MLKRSSIVLLVLTLFLLLTGCGATTKTENKANPQGEKEIVKPKQDDVVTFAYIAMAAGSPQAHINQEYTIFADQLKNLGKKVDFSSTRSLDNIWPMLDKEEGALDFAYLPVGNFATYITETSKFGGSNKYAIIAGSLNYNSYSIVTQPGVKSLKDLDGKKVGIANLRYSDEYQLNEVLSTVGLSTNSMGGTVEVVWDDIMSELMDNYANGKYGAVVVFSSVLPTALERVPGSRVFPLNPDGLFGDKQPNNWLVAKKELIKNNPELVKEVLRAHILSTDKAKAEIDKLPAIERETYLKYFKEKGADLSDKNPLEAYQKRWKAAEITYDPNMDYITGVFGFLDKRGLVKGKTIDDFMQIDLLNEVLKEMDRPVVE